MRDAAVVNADSDIEAIRAKYRQERDKRIRDDGINQYIEVKDQFASFIADPGVDVIPDRAAVSDEVDFLIVGGGFSGLLMAVLLKKAGFDNIRIVDNGGDFGGTWYWNRYPGVQCDIESYMYLPLLEDLNYMPKEKYSYGEEIRGYAQTIAKHYKLYDGALFHTQVKDIVWTGENGRWQISTNYGDDLRAKFVIMSCGNLNKPKLPGIPGIKDFGGHSFHTSRWDYKFTGENLEHLADKNVALIGTGATGIQCAPHIAKHAKHLYLFQRTPSVVNERGNKPTDPEWADALTPGWQARRRENFYALVSGIPQDEDLVQDGWTDIMKIVGATLIGSRNPNLKMSPEERDLALEMADARKMNEVRDRVEKFVGSPEVAEGLKPWYRFLCKRPTFNDEFLPMFNRPNVTLVDTQGRGVDRITKTGLVFDGVEYPADCIVFATGFEVGTEFTRKTNLEIRGRGGKTLSEHWRDDYQTLHGITSKGFPNLFFMGPNQGVGGGVNFLFPAEVQANYIVNVLLEAKKRHAETIEPTEEAMKGWAEHFRAASLTNQKFQQECTPGYFNNEGQPNTKKGFVTQRYGGGVTKFRSLVQQWQADGMIGVEFK